MTTAALFYPSEAEDVTSRRCRDATAANSLRPFSSTRRPAWEEADGNETGEELAAKTSITVAWTWPRSQPPRLRRRELRQRG